MAAVTVVFFAALTVMPLARRSFVSPLIFTVLSLFSSVSR